MITKEPDELTEVLGGNAEQLTGLSITDHNNKLVAYC